MSKLHKDELGRFAQKLIQSWLIIGKSNTLLALLDSCRQFNAHNEITALSFVLENNPGIGRRSALDVAILEARGKINYK